MQMPFQLSRAPVHPRPCLTIVEQPTQHTRFRYESEQKGAHGGLTGESSTPSKKTQPMVKLENYSGSPSDVVVRASVYTSEDPPRPHLHCLRGKTCQQDGICTVPLQNDLTAKFNMGILAVSKKDKQKKQQATQLNAEEAECEAKDMNMNCVRICFEAFLKGDQKPLCEPVFSNPISNQRPLKILRISIASGTCKGEDEVFLLCDKVNKKNIKVKFTEVDEHGNEVWSDFGQFTEADIYYQVAIVFRTPAYRDQHIHSPVKVQVQLYQQGETSEPVTFIYRPRDDDNGIERKRKKASNPHHMYGGLQGFPNRYEASLAEGMSCPLLPSIYSNLGHEQGGNAVVQECIDDPQQGFLVPNQQNAESSVSLFDSGGQSAFPMPTFPYSTNPLSNDSILLSTQDTNTEIYHPSSVSMSNFEESFDLSEYIPYLEPDSAAMPKRMARDHSVVTTEVATAKMADLKLDEEGKDKMNAPKSNQSCPTSHVVHPDWLKHPIGQFSSRLARRNLMHIPDDEGDNCIHLAVIHQPNNPFLLNAILTALGTSCPFLVNVRNHLGQTPLHLSILIGSPELTRVLLRHRADPRCCDQSGDTPVHLAASKGQANCLKELISSKESSKALYMQNFKGFTPLHLSVIYGHLNCVKILCEAMSDTNVADGMSGRTALHWAAELHPECVDILLVKGAEVNAQDYAGNTPLHLACAKGRSDMAQQLMQAGADPFAENHDWSLSSENGSLRGWTPEDFAGDDPKLRNVLAGHPISSQQDQANGSTAVPPSTTTAKAVADDHKNELFDSGFISCEIDLLDSNTLDELAKMLDPPKEHWKTLGLLLGLDKDILEGCTVFEDSPTRYIIMHYESNEGTASGLIEALKLAEMEENERQFRKAAEMVYKSLQR